jgi:hypothetical protein
MAERIVPGKTKSFIPLSISDGKIEQLPYKEAGIIAVNFGPRSVTNTIPAAAAQKYLLPTFGRKTLTNFGTQFQQMTENAQALMRHAESVGQADHWSHFYEDAHAHATHLADRYGITHAQASGILASMSGGGGEWETNKENANRFLEARENGVNIGTKQLKGVESSRINNAHLIFDGANPQEVLGKMKERNFMESIHDPSGDSLTMDTHMHHGMTGWKRPWRGAGGGAPGLGDPRVYHFMAEAVRGVAADAGMSPNAAQSTLWYANKDITGGLAGSVPPHHPRFAEYFPKVKPGIMYRKPSEA